MIYAQCVVGVWQKHTWFNLEVGLSEEEDLESFPGGDGAWNALKIG